MNSIAGDISDLTPDSIPSPIELLVLFLRTKCSDH